jgi:hypothetical protein
VKQRKVGATPTFLSLFMFRVAGRGASKTRMNALAIGLPSFQPKKMDGPAGQTGWRRTGRRRSSMKAMCWRSRAFFEGAGTKWCGNGLMDRDAAPDRALHFIWHRSGKQCAKAAETASPPSILPSHAQTRDRVAAGGAASRRRHGRSVMKMRVKAALVKAAAAAIGGAVAVASPVTAQNWQAPNGRYANVPVSTDNVFWGLAYAPLQAPAYGLAYGSAAGIPAGRPVPGIAAAPPPRILDCVHVTFPQCGGVGGN